MADRKVCLHCLSVGEWSDADSCPDCVAAGHSGPWGADKCPACEREFFARMTELAGCADQRQHACAAMDALRDRVALLEGLVRQLIARKDGET